MVSHPAAAGLSVAASSVVEPSGCGLAVSVQDALKVAAKMAIAMLDMIFCIVILLDRDGAAGRSVPTRHEWFFRGDTRDGG
jgi:hypothetical protein